MFERIADALRNAVTRGKVAQTAVQARTVMQTTGLDNETFNGIELLLPPGYSARPAAGADVLHLQVLGSRDHVVAIGGDSTGGDAITDLAAGEFGLRHAASGAQIVMRSTGVVEITAAIVTMSGDLRVAGEVYRGYGGADQVSLGGHKHKQGLDSNGDTEVDTDAPTAGT